MKLKASALALCVAAAFAVPAQAAFDNDPLPSNAYITYNGLEWAWAMPVPGDGSWGVALDLSVQGTLGWRLPTAAELAMAPNATDFMFAGANVPLGGVDPVSGSTFSAVNANLTGDAACAAAYFNNSYHHCDWQDGNGQTFGPWFGTPGAQSFADTLVVRAVPEPETYGLMALGLVGIGAAVRRRRA